VWQLQGQNRDSRAETHRMRQVSPPPTTEFSPSPVASAQRSWFPVDPFSAFRACTIQYNAHSSPCTTLYHISSVCVPCERPVHFRACTIQYNTHSSPCTPLYHISSVCVPCERPVHFRATVRDVILRTTPEAAPRGLLHAQGWPFNTRSCMGLDGGKPFGCLESRLGGALITQQPPLSAAATR